MKNRIISFALVAALMLGVSPAMAAEEEIRIGIIDSGISTLAIEADHLAEGRNYILPGTGTEDLTGHGTAVASIIVGSESAGIKGLCPEATLVPLVFVSQNEYGYPVAGNSDELAAVIREAIDVYDCDILNISLTSRHPSDSLAAAIAYAETQGVLVVSSVGNNGSAVVYYPAGYSSVLCVGSVNEAGTDRTSFSNLNNSLDILAPGIDVPVAGLAGEATTQRGTSFSSAYVTGVAAELMRQYPGLTAGSVRRILCASAEDLKDEGFDIRTGWGLLNEDAAFTWAAQGRRFRDTDPRSWDFDGITYMVNEGLMNGTGVVEFTPGGTTTRAMVWVMLHRMDGGATGGNTWYAASQSWVKAKGIADGKYPDSVVTREEIVTMMYHYAKYKGLDVKTDYDLSKYKDHRSVTGTGAEAFRWACGKGIINGIGGALSPKGDATRAQIAAVFMRFDKLVG